LEGENAAGFPSVDIDQRPVINYPFPGRPTKTAHQATNHKGALLNNVIPSFESLANAIINSCSDAIVTKSLDGTIRSWNPGAQRIFGYTAEEVVGKAITLLFPDDRINEELAIIARIKRGEIVDHYETVRKHKDGRLIDISLTISPIWDEHRQIIGASKIARDITEQKRLERTSQHMSAVVSSSNDAIITKTLDGIITSWNPSAQRIFEYTPEEAIGKSVTILFPPDHINEEMEIIARIRRGERIDHYETERLAKSGRIVPISLTVSPILDVHGKIIGVSKIARDITAQKEYEQHLIRQADELEQFAYVASHDLREPLRKVAVYTDMLVNRYIDSAESEAKKCAHNIVDAVSRMQRLITDLLAYSKANRSDMSFDPVDLNRVAAEVLDNLEVLIREKQVKITLGHLPDKLWASSFQMHQLFQNLIANAIKFHGPSAPEISVTAKTENGHVLVSVQDNGIGIDSQYRERIFRVFQRLHPVQQYPGTGIGLAICKKIVERHGGKIWVESEPNKGSTFCFSLPLRQGDSEQ
jgi:PAS domain S-box-containing protein